MSVAFMPAPIAIVHGVGIDINVSAAALAAPAEAAARLSADVLLGSLYADIID